MDRDENQPKSQTQTATRSGGISHDHEAETYWDQLTDEDRRLIWLTASGKDVREVAADVAETPREVARRYRTLLGKFGLDDRSCCRRAYRAGTDCRTPGLSNTTDALQGLGPGGLGAVPAHGSQDSGVSLE